MEKYLLPFERFIETENEIIQICDDAQIKNNIVINFSRNEESIHTTLNNKLLLECQLLMFYGISDELTYDILNDIKYVNLNKLNDYLINNKITKFDSEQEALEYFNVYCPEIENFESINEMLDYEDIYGFTIDGAHYHIDFDEALDVYE